MLRLNAQHVSFNSLVSLSAAKTVFVVREFACDWFLVCMSVWALGTISHWQCCFLDCSSSETTKFLHHESAWNKYRGELTSLSCLLWLQVGIVINNGPVCLSRTHDSLWTATSRFILILTESLVCDIRALYMPIGVKIPIPVLTSCSRRIS